MSELIAGEMRRLKKLSGLSFAKLAARTHYSRSSWERFLNGKKPVPREAVEQFASVMGDGAGALLLMGDSAAAGGSAESGQFGRFGQFAASRESGRLVASGESGHVVVLRESGHVVKSGELGESGESGESVAAEDDGRRGRGRGPFRRRPSPAELFAAGMAVGALAVAAAGWWAERAGGASRSYGRCPCAGEAAGVPLAVSHSLSRAVSGVPSWWDGAYDG